MNFEEMIKALKQGKRVKNKDWDDGIFMYLGEHGMFVNQDGESCELEGIQEEWEEYKVPFLTYEDKTILNEMVKLYNKFDRKIIGIRRENEGDEKGDYLVITTRNGFKEECTLSPHFKQRTKFQALTYGADYTLKGLELEE